MSIKQITPVTEEEKRVIKNKTAYGLPDRPSYTGMKASEIKAAFWTPLIDASGDKSHSIMSVIERVIEELNKILEDVADKNDTVQSQKDVYNSSSIRLYGFKNGEDTVTSPRTNTSASEANGTDAELLSKEVVDKALGTDENGEFKKVSLYKGTVMSRDNNGRSSILTPALPKHIANKQYVDESISARTVAKSMKRPEEGLTPFLYGINSSGDAVIFALSLTTYDPNDPERPNEAGADISDDMRKRYASTIMSRDSNGRSSIIGPVSPKHIANKEYVDKGDVVIKDGVGNLLKSVTFELTGTTLNIITSQEKK